MAAHHLSLKTSPIPKLLAMVLAMVLALVCLIQLYASLEMVLAWVYSSMRL
jgi:hypothetical protein